MLQSGYMTKYLPSRIEPKWQKKWKETSLYTPNLDSVKNPYYALMMFPYPSAEGLHVGNMYAFTGVDITGRFHRMQGLDVFEPIGLDGFGIHSENYALKINEHPMKLSKITEKRFYEQLTMIGNGYDWTRTVETYKPGYYKWTQWLFLQMYKKGLAYRRKAAVNWCPSCLTVLADEQVIAGECERCGATVIQKELEQWFFKITDYVDKLLSNLETIDWSPKVKIAQRNWIGKSEGTLITFDDLEVFTTRPDTLFGATFVVISPEHPLLSKFIKPGKEKEVEQYAQEAAKKSELERKENKEKTGIFTGSYVTNPINKEKIPVWVADYVLAGYGTGAIMAVPAHDQRDFEFAKKFGIEIKKVIEGGSPREAGKEVEAFTGEGKMINSGEYNGLSSSEAREKISDYIEKDKLGKRQSQYHLRDWLISRQRYWGPPIPIIYCDKCGIVPVPEKDLPVELPYVADFRPKGKGQSPLASEANFYNVKCSKCGGDAKRETDVSDTFLDSAWYFLRYPSTEFEDKPFDNARNKKWLPVDIYIGGAEHSVLHLLYARFITMVLKDMGMVDFEEPFTKFIAHGLLIKDGAKISKSKGNVVNPDESIVKHGADTLRTYLMFMGPYTDGGDFRDSGMNGIARFLERVWNLQNKVNGGDMSDADLKMMHKIIKNVSKDMLQMKFNTSIAFLMQWLNYLSAKKEITKQEYKTLLLLLAPFAPHMTEELWSQIGEKYSVHQQSWPKFDEKFLGEEEIKIVVQVNGKVRDLLLIGKDIINSKEIVEKMAQDSEKIKKFLVGKEAKKTIYVPGKIVNLVV